MQFAFNTIWYLSVAMAVVAVFRIAMAPRVLSRYTALFAFIVFDVLQNLVFIALARHAEYATYSVLLQFLPPIGWMIQCWMVVEIFDRWSERYPGIGRFGRMLLIVFGVSSVVIGAAIGWRSYSILEWVQTKQGAFTLRTAASFGLTLFLILTVFFFRFLFRPSSPTNLLRHTWISLFCFLLISGRTVLHNFRLVPVLYLQFAAAVIWLACYTSWAVAMSKKGEIVRVPSGRPLNEESIAVLDYQLTRGFQTVAAGRRRLSRLMK